MEPDRERMLLNMVERLAAGENPEADGNDPLACAIVDTHMLLRRKLEQLARLSTVLESVNRGLTLDEVVERIFRDFDRILPYDRIGLALVEGSRVVSRANHSRAGTVYLSQGFEASLSGSSLEAVLTTRQPRIINDLARYLEEKPDSTATALILQEDLRASFTCPLVVEDTAVGFLFFTSKTPGIYRDAHSELFLAIAGQVSAIIEKGRQYQRLLELDELKNRFLGIAAHDLRSPLSLVRSYLGVLREGYLGDLTDKQRDMMQRMDTTCATMMGLINDLLDISAIESGKLSLNFQPTDLNDYLRIQFENARVLASAKEIDVRLDVEGTLPSVALDAARMDQVLGNLVTNAIKFSHPRTCVTLSARVEGAAVLITVRDQGQGIPEEDLKKLFGAFSKTRVKPTGGEKSTGLGLHIVAKIVAAHGGRIDVASRVGEGSAFTVALPLGVLPVQQNG